MELLLGSDPRTERLRRLQPLLIQRFGRIERAAANWRAPEWVLVQGVIGARTHSDISNGATDRMLTRWGSWEAVAGVPLAELQAELSTQTYPNIAAQRLKDCLTALVEARGRVDLSHLEDMPTIAAMDWLETLPGIGRKIAAGVVNASTLHRKAMVLDSHHRRILQRMGLVPPKADTARAYKALEPILPDEWTAADYDEHHLLMKEVGRNHCRPQGLDCRNCPAQALCDTGRAEAGDEM
ncbi:MAG: endonuclease III [Pacificimonas sp.]